MAVYRACYCTRYDVMSAPDIALTPDMARHVDSAIQSAAEDVDKLCHRRFWTGIESNYYDWPGWQSTYPWKLYFNEKELADSSTAVLAVGGDDGQGVAYTVIPSSQVKYMPQRYGPPYSWLELDRSTSAAFGGGPTPQQAVKVTGPVGYWTASRPAGTLAAAVSSTSATTVTVSDSSLASVGDVITAGSEAMLVSDVAMADTGQAQQGSGLSTALDNDVALTVTDGSKYQAGEVLQLDSEMVFILSVTGNVLTVIRAWGGTVLAAHSGAEVYALRQMTVIRGFGGTTAATHGQGDALTAALVPSMVRELAIAESLNYVYQKTSGYARTIGENTRVVPGGSLPDLRKRVFAGFGRTRSGVV